MFFAIILINIFLVLLFNYFVTSKYFTLISSFKNIYILQLNFRNNTFDKITSISTSNEALCKYITRKRYIKINILIV